MSHSDALEAAKRLKAHMEARGVKCSIELQPDVNGTWDVLAKRGIISHHTASYIRQGLTPLLALVKKGRSDVRGPLANGYGGRDLVYRIITMGKANHAGRGGPLRLQTLVPQDYGNRYTWGTEYEGGYEDWSLEMRIFMAKANAALLDYFDFELRAAAEHKTWTPRKVDRRDYTDTISHAEIVKYGAKTQPAPKHAPKPQNPWSGKNPNEVHALGSRVLRIYDAGTDVKYVQTRLKLTLDGFYGTDSVKAVKAYQKANGIPQTGMVDGQTWRKLTGGPVPNVGSKAPDGAALLPVDGKFERADIVRLQNVLGVKPTGNFKDKELAVALQKFLNKAVAQHHIKNLTGRSQLATDGDAGTKTIRVLQFYLFTKYAESVLKRRAVYGDFDGVRGEKTNKLLQFALNKANASAKKF